MIPLSVPHIAGNEWDYVKECLDTGWVSSAGRFVDRFESKMAESVSVGHAVACVSGTAALHVALLCVGVSSGDEVIVPTLTFIAPVNTILYVGAHPVFMDCDKHLNIDVGKVQDFCTKECDFRNGVLINKTSGRSIRAILPVHVFGHPVDMEPLLGIAERYHLKVIEDATESLGSRYVRGRDKGRHTGTVGHVGCFSFNGNKIITTGGGGMIVTDNEQIARRAKYLTTQAKDDAERFVHDEVGFNYRLTNVQAAIGCAQLERLDEYVGIKRKHFEIYRRLLENVPGLSLVTEPAFGRSNYWHYTLVVDERCYGCGAENLRGRLKENGIETRMVWELSHRQKPYRGFQAYRIEEAIRCQAACLNLPCSVSLEESTIERVCDEIRG